uniref:Aspartate 1-decarboxylase n=1 Tax=Ammonifex degensii TaxID=42838 RepID=A0A7C2I1F7_9THEO
MFLAMLRGKIHRATVTGTNLEYVGSITVDEALLEAADILPGERVQVFNLNNGERFETYTLSGTRDSGVVCLNGPAARLAQPGDKVIVIAYAFVPYQEARGFRPRIVVVDEKNKPVEVRRGDSYGTTEETARETSPY